MLEKLISMFLMMIPSIIMAQQGGAGGAYGATGTRGGWYTWWWFWVIIALAVIFFIWAVSGWGRGPRDTGTTTRTGV